MVSVLASQSGLVANQCCIFYVPASQSSLVANNFMSWAEQCGLKSFSVRANQSGLIANIFVAASQSGLVANIFFSVPASKSGLVASQRGIRCLYYIDDEGQKC